MKTITFIIALSMTIIQSVRARDWGFSNDTVCTWKTGQNNVLIRNQGTDTLKADTLIFEIIRPNSSGSGAYGAGFTYASYSGNMNSRGTTPSGILTISKSIGSMPIPPNKSDSLYSFYVHYFILAKASAVAATGDTTVGRLILAATSNRGRDTIIFSSIATPPTGIFNRINFNRPHTEYRFFDPIGRAYSFDRPNQNFPGVPFLHVKQ